MSSNPVPTPLSGLFRFLILSLVLSLTVFCLLRRLHLHSLYLVSMQQVAKGTKYDESSIRKNYDPSAFKD